jgi:Zn finger protein HypA/HybF involved in hydrogenase expression
MIMEEKNMAKCIKCGTDVGSPKKRWKMAGRPDKSGKRTQLEIGLFECPKCQSKFRVVLSKQKI